MGRGWSIASCLVLLGEPLSLGSGVLQIAGLLQGPGHRRVLRALAGLGVLEPVLQGRNRDDLVADPAVPLAAAVRSGAAGGRCVRCFSRASVDVGFADPGAVVRIGVQR